MAFYPTHNFLFQSQECSGCSIKQRCRSNCVVSEIKCHGGGEIQDTSFHGNTLKTKHGRKLLGGNNLAALMCASMTNYTFHTSSVTH